MECYRRPPGDGNLVKEKYGDASDNGIAIQVNIHSSLSSRVWRRSKLEMNGSVLSAAGIQGGG